MTNKDECRMAKTRLREGQASCLLPDEEDEMSSYSCVL